MGIVSSATWLCQDYNKQNRAGTVKKGGGHRELWVKIFNTEKLISLLNSSGAAIRAVVIIILFIKVSLLVLCKISLKTLH